MSDTYAPLQPPKRLLMGPGPSMVHPRVYEAMSKPIVGHLDPYFFAVVEDIRALLKTTFGTQNEFTLAISGTGSAGMETAVTNFVEPGTKVAILANGYFCERISEMAKRHDAEVVRLEKPWGEIFSDSEAADFIDRQKPDVVAYVQAETSTGAFQPGEAICQAAHDVGALVIADCVTSLGTMPVRVDATGIDIAYSCSQKGLSCPPGLAPVTISERARARMKTRKAPIQAWYLDLNLLDEYFGASHRYHHTAPITMFYALREGLAAIAEEGLENRWERHRLNHLAFVAGLEAMGLGMHVDQAHRLWALNTPRTPDGVSDMKVRQHMMQRHGIEILGGFGPLAGRVFRIGLMGYGSTSENVITVLDALEEALREEGYTPKSNGAEAARAFYADQETAKSPAAV
jgi:alanine-glyoxylate transaminase / serine-glyoxylate transaminase / serine-pyruvate transaminase